LRAAIAAERIPLRLVGAAEVSLVWAHDASEAQLVLASYGQRGTDLLIETPNLNVALAKVLSRLREHGYRVTLGHPERTTAFHRDYEPLRAFADRPVTQLEQAVEALASLIGPDRAEWMARTAPAAIVAGTELPDAPPVAPGRRRRWPFGQR
jgi:hypothetical protein